MYAVCSNREKKACKEVNSKFQEQCTLHMITDDNAENKRREDNDEPIFSQLVSVCINDAYPEKKKKEMRKQFVGGSIFEIKT